MSHRKIPAPLAARLSPSLMALGLVVSGSSQADVARLPTVPSSIELGQGLDLISGTMLGQCIKGQSSTPTSNATSGNTSLSIQRLASSADLLHTLGLPANATYYESSSPLAAKAAFTDTFRINQRSLFLAISVKVSSPLETLANVTLSQAALDLLNDQGAPAFRETCGDAFVTSIAKGGEFVAVVELLTEDDQEKKSLDQALKVFYGESKGQVSFSKEFQDVLMRQATKVYVYETGGRFAPAQSDIGQILAEAVQFPSTVKASAFSALQFASKPFHTLENFPGNGAALETEASTAVLAQLASDELRLTDALLDLEYLFSHRYEYSYITDSFFFSLEYSADAIRSVLKEIKADASSCLASAKQCTASNYEIPPITVPPRQGLID